MTSATNGVQRPAFLPLLMIIATSFLQYLDILCPTDKKKQKIVCSLLHPTITEDAILTHKKQKTAKSFWISRLPMLCFVRNQLSRISPFGKKAECPQTSRVRFRQEPAITMPEASSKSRIHELTGYDKRCLGKSRFYLGGFYTCNC